MTDTLAAQKLPQAGDIWTSSWGYDQTNVDFYVVVKSTPKTVWLQEVGSKVEETGFMSGKAVADPERVLGPVFRRKLTSYSGRYSCSITSYAAAWPWNGQPQSSSWYA